MSIGRPTLDALDSVAADNCGSARRGSDFNRVARRERAEGDVEVMWTEESTIVGRRRDVGESAECAVDELQRSVKRTMNRVVEAGRQVREHGAAGSRGGHFADAAEIAARQSAASAVRSIESAGRNALLDDRAAVRRHDDFRSGRRGATRRDRHVRDAGSACEQRTKSAEELARGTSAGSTRGATHVGRLRSGRARGAVLRESVS